MYIGTVKRIPCYLGTYIPDGPADSGFPTSKFTLGIPDGHTNTRPDRVREGCRGLLTIHFSLAEPDEACLIAK